MIYVSLLFAEHQVALKFPSPFWQKTVGNADFFGHVASTQERRGMFGVFYDMSPRPSSSSNERDSTEQKDKAYILVTTVSGEALKDYQKMSDEEIVDLCVRTLRLMFPQENVPPPDSYLLSRWGNDPFAQMSYSYVAVGSSGEDYNVMAEEVAGKIFFAGEVSVYSCCNNVCIPWKFTDILWFIDCSC